MSKTQAETVIKNIIREIVQECTTRGQIVSETLVAFTVNAFLQTSLKGNAKIIIKFNIKR